MEYRVLGPLEVLADDGPLPLGGAKQRALLALLALNVNRVVARERLVDGLWGEAPPESAVKLVKQYVWQLRKLLPDGTIVTRSPGYALAAGLEAVDALRFERLVADARAAAPADASRLLREALGLWRGPALADLTGEPFARVEAGRLDDLRVGALELRIDADLALGRHGELVGELETLVADEPHREPLRRQLMLALYRSGRQAEALEAYREAQAALDDLGLEPGSDLRELQRRILLHDPGLDVRLQQPLLAGGVIQLPGPLVPEPAFPFVGRDEELTTLSSLLERAEGGEGGLVLVAAEAGGGKTRLIREFAHEAANRGTLVLYGTSDAAVTTPYQPLREWLEFLLRVCDPEALRDCLGGGADELARLVPELSALTGHPPEQRDPANERFVLHGAVTDLFARLGRGRPLLLVADDVHWADGETLHLLRRLGRAAPEARWLVVAAYRGEETGDELAHTVGDLVRLDGVTRLTPGSLSQDDVGEFVRRSTEAEASAELVSALGELSDGTPLLLCELWRDLSERGGVEVEPTARLTRPLSGLRGPDRVAELVRQRLTRLDPETVALLDLAAVVGPQFELRLLTEAAGSEPAAFAAPLEEAVRSGIVEELTGLAPELRFSHELVRRAVYDRLTGIRRPQVHLQVAEALERLHAADTDRVLSELAHHFSLASPVAGPERGVSYSLRAGYAATAAGAFGEGAARLQSALELGIDDPRERALAQIELANLIRDGGRWNEAAALLASLDAAAGFDEPGLAARARVALSWIVQFDAGSTNPDEATAVAEEAIETLTALGETRGLGEAWRLLGLARGERGRTTEAIAASERAAEHGGGFGARAALIVLSHAFVRGPMPVGEAIQRCGELLRLHPENRPLEATAACCLSALLAMAGRFEESRELAERSARALAEDDSACRWTRQFRETVAEAKELVGDRAGAERELETWWREADAGREGALDVRALRAAYHLALLYCDEGRWDAAADCLDYGRDVPVRASFTTQAPVLGLAGRARLAASRGDLEEAVTLARRGVELVDETDLLNLRARVRLARAEVEHASGETAKADADVGAALVLYEQKGNIAAATLVRARTEPPFRRSIR